MKKIFTLFAMMFLTMGVLSAQKLSYQAVVRNSANELVYDASVTVSLKILAADGVTVQYAETLTTTTNQNGLLTLIIGEHPTGTYSLNNVNWADASIKTEITLPTGDVVTNTMPVTAVPYALFADNTGSSVSQVQSDWMETNPESNAYILNKPTLPTIPTNVGSFFNDAGYLTSYTETQTLADVTANGNSVGNRQLKNVSDPTDPQDAVTKSYLTAQAETITASIQQQLDNLASQYQQQLGNLTNSFQHQLDSLGGVIGAQQAIINAQQHKLDSLINGGFTPTPAAPTVTSTFPCTPTSMHTPQTAALGYSASGANHGLETVNANGQINSVTDYDGNVYPVVQIGSQCWLAENLRCTHSPSTGTYIVDQEGHDTYTGKMATWYTSTASLNGNSVTMDSAACVAHHFGLLYNWNAAVDVYNPSYGELSINSGYENAVDTTFSGDCQGICPRGWHVPTDAELSTMESVVNGSDVSQAIYYRGSHAGKLAGGDDWNSSTSSDAPGDYNNTNRNSSGFTAVPAGSFHGSSASAGHCTYFWSSSQNEGSTKDAWNRFLSHYDVTVDRYYNYKYLGISVRCLRDESGNTAIALAATTSDATDITANSATLKGTISNPNHVNVTARGFEWKATSGGTYTPVSATGNSMSYSLDGLTANTSYTYRAFVTTGYGTSYGEEVTFTTLAVISSFPCTVTSTHPAQTVALGYTANGANHGLETVNANGQVNSVTDYDGNEYPVVQIGGQCWLAQNMRCTHYADGTDIPAGGNSSSNTSPCYYDYISSNILMAQRGYLYNWAAAMHGAASSTASPSGVQGVCPNGWHLPSDAEWNTMEASVSGSDWQNSYETTTGVRGTHAGKLAGGDDWLYSATTGAPGNKTYSQRNVSGFSAVPAGSCHGSSFYYASFSAYFWSSSEHSDGSFAWYHNLENFSAGVDRDYDSKFNGFSVRCVRN